MRGKINFIANKLIDLAPLSPLGTRACARKIDTLGNVVRCTNAFRLVRTRPSHTTLTDHSPYYTTTMRPPRSAFLTTSCPTRASLTCFCARRWSWL